MTQVFRQRFRLTSCLTSNTTESDLVRANCTAGAEGGVVPKTAKSGQPKQDGLPGEHGRAARSGGNQPPQPQAPPQQPPPDGAGAAAPALRPPTATVDSSFTVSSWPSGHAHGAEDSLIGRVTSNVEPQARQRYS
jgi:hypothetical protein